MSDGLMTGRATDREIVLFTLEPDDGVKWVGVSFFRHKRKDAAAVAVELPDSCYFTRVTTGAVSDFVKSVKDALKSNPVDIGTSYFSYAPEIRKGREWWVGLTFDVDEAVVRVTSEIEKTAGVWCAESVPFDSDVSELCAAVMDAVLETEKDAAVAVDVEKRGADA